MRVLKTFGIVTGVGLAFAVMVGFFAGAMSARESMAGLVVFVVSSIIGFPLGVIVGLTVANKAFHQPGSLTLGILGTILGVAILFFLLRYELIRAAPFGLTGLYIAAFLVPLIPGMLGFLLKGRYKAAAHH
ncbi:MAG: hypothetical protein HY667_06005 [Chloroflexi bacterium]|nr:hypothetical protein [Chloroflexota bacterium]